MGLTGDLMVSCELGAQALIAMQMYTQETYSYTLNDLKLRKRIRPWNMPCVESATFWEEIFDCMCMDVFPACMTLPKGT